MAQIECPKCGKKIALPETPAGAVHVCPSCGGALDVRPKGVFRTVLAAGLDRPRIGQLLVEEGLVTEGQLREALAHQRKEGGKLADVLIRLGYLDPHALVNFLARQPGVASIDLQNYAVPADLIALIPREMALKHEVFPIDRLGRLLTLAMAFPLDKQAITELQDATGLRIKALLCSPSDIRAAVNRYYPLAPPSDATGADAHHVNVEEIHSAVRLRGVAALIHTLKSLPALPETVSRVRAAMSDIGTTVAEVADIIAMDPPIAASVLGVANSAAYGFRSHVNTLELAVSLLGLRETYTLVTSASIINIFDRSRRFDYKGFWVDAMGCAAAARVVAESVRGRNLKGAVTGAILHDIGRIALLEVVPERYTEIPIYLEGAELIAAEQRYVGLAHPEAGHELAIHWELPGDIAEAIRFHHTPENATEHPDAVAAVALAVALARSETATPEDEQHLCEACQPLLARLGVGPREALVLLHRIKELGCSRFFWGHKWDDLRRSTRSR